MVQRIFGIGLSKTGTTSLNTALRSLGIPSLHFPKPKMLFTNVASTDSPCVYYLDSLLKAFPDCKLIYTTRNDEDWLESCKIHFGRVKLTPYGYFLRKGIFGTEDPKEKDFLKAKRNHEKKLGKIKKEILTLDLDKNDDKMQLLCDFLEKERPQGLDYPITNVTQVD